MSLAAFFPADFPMRSLISDVAAVVKVIARIFDGCRPYKVRKNTKLKDTINLISYLRSQVQKMFYIIEQR